MRELLVFLCERALSDPGTAIREQDIGTGVFGRPVGYDTTQDTLVRVQVYQLRKRLQQHFDSEGQDEPVVIEIPKGSYTPVFRGRETDSRPESSAGVRRFWPGASLVTVSLAVVALVASASCVWLALRLAASNGPAVPGFEPRPAVDRLWAQMFGNGRPACVVPSDASLVVFQDLIKRQLNVNEYRHSQFARIAEEFIPNTQVRAAAKLIVTKPFTHAADAQLVGVAEVLNAAFRIHTDVVFPRDFGISYLESHNVLLMGTRRANPWVELFEERLNFRTRFEESAPAVFFDNHAPLPGEETTYADVWGRQAYCRVAFLRNLTGTGNVLIVSGTDMASTQAGAQFISTDSRINALRSRLALAPTARFPYFEVLLRVAYPTARAPAFEVVAHRTPRT